MSNLTEQNEINSTEQEAKQTSKEKNKEIDKELKNIYRDSHGKMPNLTQLDYLLPNSKRNIFIGSVFVLAVFCLITFFGFLVFKNNPKFSNKKVTMEIKAPFTLNSGELINYHIKITNNEGISLTKTRLDINFPLNFSFINANLPTSDTPATGNNIKTWNIGDLMPEQSEIIDINGYLIAPLNSKQVLATTLSYTPTNFSSEFQKNENFTTEIINSLINIESEYPAQLANKEVTDLKIKIRNKSEQTALTNLQAEFEFPQEFSLLTGQIMAKGQTAKDIIIPKNKEPETSPYILELGGLLPQEEKIIIYHGKFEVSESKKLDFNLRVKQKGSAGEYILQKEAQFSMEIIKGDLLANLIIQGSNQNKPVNFGDTLSFLISLRNKSTKALGDIKVSAIIESSQLDRNSFSDQNNGRLDGSQILWTKEQIPELALLLPEEEIEINFQIKIKDFESAKTYSVEDLQIKSFFETQVNKINNEETEVELESNIIINEINTNLALESQGRYFGNNSETIGSGPLPPIVGQKTTYKIFWKLTNSLHEISNIEVKTKLPDYIIYEGNNNLSAGTLIKNGSNELVWQISRVPVSVNEVTAEFEISLTPKSNDVQKVLTLMQDIYLKATDNQTKGELLLNAPGITTNLDTDPLGKGKGLILAE
ncbi:MAG: hypothetical protein NTZ49_01985 [Candidatus Parcubacteria bacterium]|nr:hypothetical protein [Candidatus Parcubacteria bacterium]